MALSPTERPSPHDSEAELAGRPITMEEVVRRQVERIAWLRSFGEPWGEAVQQLRDMVVGMEDDEFWDGVPPEARKALDRVTGERAAEIRRQYAHLGWDGVPIRAFRGPNGPIYSPTEQNLSDQLRIILRLLSRKRITWRTKRRAWLLGPDSGDE